MSYEKGSLSIHSENIFPIIKKWLYSDHDIFVRELVSNASDAITKLERLHGMGEANIEDRDYRVNIILDTEAKTLKFIDNGIGMTDEEIKKYINQIAFSGAEDFLEKYKDKTDKDQIIGHFGLGFYSAFMVADKVEINTLSYLEGATAAKWHCDGGTEFELEEGTKETRGTEITLYLGEDGTEFNSKYRIEEILKKYCSFMPYPIYFEVLGEEAKKEKNEDGEEIEVVETPVNNVSPLYTLKSGECEAEDYKKFYMDTFKDFSEPLFWIHLNMDYPFNLKGILYFPKLKNEFDTMEGQIKLYNNRVFVADNIKEVIPEFLLLLKGVIDCPDIPLNVSRSFLQNDGFVKKISDYITKKVADKLNGLYNTEKEEYEKFWTDISPFIKFGSLKNEKFYNKVEDIVLYKSINDDYKTLGELKEANTVYTADDKDPTTTVYYVSDMNQQNQYINMIKEHDLDAVILDHGIDNPFISFIESKNPGLSFKRVDSDISDSLVDSEHEADEELDKKLAQLFKDTLGNDKLDVEIKPLKNPSVSGIIVLSEDKRRMQEMMKMYGMNGMGGLDPNMFGGEEKLILNKKNPLIVNLEKEEIDIEMKSKIVNHIYDLAMLSHKPLDNESMTKFVNRTNEIMTALISK